jgi:RNA polymerase sigma factor (sigma-70 family)
MLMPDVPHADVQQLVGHLFRRESGRLVAILTRHFGIEHLPLAEDVVQDALVKAMQTWPDTGVPDNPSAWLLQAAKNRALDLTRRDSVWRGKQEALVPLMEDCLQSSLTRPSPQFEDEIHDSQLRMMFVCCHPGLAAEAQVALILKTLCGFGEKEIAAAFLAGEAAVTKRLVRARQYLREQEVAVELPPAAALAPRVEAIQQALYLLFNEGYKASHGDSLLREDLCAEAVRLGELLAAHPAGDRPATHALLALMWFNASRLPARTDDAGGLLLLADQDRSRWRREDIARGVAHLGASSAGDRITRYHLEAGIAAAHALAPSFAATNWTQIVELYDQLLALDGSPVVALSRAVAVGRLEGAAAGLRALAEIGGSRALANYHLFHSVRGQLHLEAGEPGRAADCFRRALALVTLPAERALLEKRLAQCNG